MEADGTPLSGQRRQVTVQRIVNTINGYTRQLPEEKLIVGESHSFNLRPKTSVQERPGHALQASLTVLMIGVPLAAISPHRRAKSYPPYSFAHKLAT